MNVNEVVSILKAIVPVLLGKYFTRLKVATISEFVKKVDHKEESYRFENGDEEGVTWSHFFFGDDIVIGIGRRGEKVKAAKTAKKRS